MLSKNLSAVSAVAFAATPQDPEDTLQDLIDLLSDDQPIYINSDGTVVVTSVSQHPSSLTELRNVSRNPEDALQNQDYKLNGIDPENISADGAPDDTSHLVETGVSYMDAFQELVKLLTDDQSGNLIPPSDRILADPPISIDTAREMGLIRDPVSRMDTPQNVSRISTDAKRFAAVPWYESDSNLVYRGSDLHITGKQLWETEKKVMLRQFPQAKTGIMKTTGELYWIVPVDINIGSTTKRWTFMLKYDNNHPHADDWGGSVKAIPMIPSIDELESRAKAAGRISSGKYSKREHVPHIWRNYNDHTLYLDTASKRTQAELLSKHTIQSATSAMLSAVRWAYFYEVGLLDSKVWDEFCGFGNIPERCFSPSTADYPMELDRWLEANEKRENGE